MPQVVVMIWRLHVPGPMRPCFKCTLPSESEMEMHAIRRNGQTFYHEMAETQAAGKFQIAVSKPVCPFHFAESMAFFGPGITETTIVAATDDLDHEMTMVAFADPNTLEVQIGVARWRATAQEAYQQFNGGGGAFLTLEV